MVVWRRLVTCCSSCRGVREVASARASTSRSPLAATARTSAMAASADASCSTFDKAGGAADVSGNCCCAAAAGWACACGSAAAAGVTIVAGASCIGCGQLAAPDARSAMLAGCGAAAATAGCCLCSAMSAVALVTGMRPAGHTTTPGLSGSALLIPRRRLPLLRPVGNQREVAYDSDEQPRASD